MRIARLLPIVLLGLSLAGCANLPAGKAGEVVVQATARVAVDDPATDRRGAFPLVRSMLCRSAFAEAMTNLAARTGRDEDSLRGATISGIGEGYTNGVYTLKLDVAWSPTREDAALGVLSVTNVAEAVAYVPSVDDERSLAAWIGPKQVGDADGTIHFLGISAMAVGRNTVVSQQNIRKAELDAQEMAIRPFMGKSGKMTDVKARFRQVLRLRTRHPLCPEREMYACGYEVLSLGFTEK